MKKFLLPKFNLSNASTRISAGLLALRLVAGVAFMLHGWGKITNPFAWMGPDSTYPAFLQGLAALAEFGGGLGWFLGLLTPLASVGIICTMVVAASVHINRGDGFIGGYEMATLYLAIGLVFLTAGPGRYSLDHIRAKGK